MLIVAQVRATDYFEPKLLSDLRILGKRDFVALNSTSIHIALQVFDKHRNVLKQNVFKVIPVDALIIVRNPIAQPRDITKRYFWAKLDINASKGGSSLTDDLKVHGGFHLQMVTSTKTFARQISRLLHA